VSGVAEKRGYGFYGSPTAGYSQTLFVTTGNDVSACACTTGFVRMRPFASPGYNASLRELRAWFEEVMTNTGAAGASTPPTPPDLDDADTLFSRFPRINLYLDTDDELNPLLPPNVKPIQYFVYRNLEPVSVYEALKDKLVARVITEKVTSKLPSSLNTAAVKPLFAFFFFWVTNQAIRVSVGDLLGTANTVAGERVLGLDVWHYDGPIDPVYFFESIKGNSLFPTEEEQRWDQLRGVLSAQGKIFSPTVDSDRAAFRPDGISFESDDYKTHALPYPVLKQLRTLLPWDAANRVQSELKWRTLGHQQKGVYRGRLLMLAALRKIQTSNEAGRPGPNASDEALLADEVAALQSHPEVVAPFRFNNADWRNIFQLEAIAEFYLNFVEPLKEGAKPIAPSESNLKVDLLDAKTLPGLPAVARTSDAPLCRGTSSDLYLVQIDDFRLVGGLLPQQKLRGLKPNGSPWAARDEYRGMMFIVKQGEIKGKFRFTSFTSRKHRKLQQRTSIAGNREYGFFSKISSSKHGINYSFLVVDAASWVPSTKLPGRTFFEPTVAEGTKGSIMIHNGYETASGSEGCQVSFRYFYPFRQMLIETVLGDLGEIRRLETCYPDTLDPAHDSAIPDLQEIARQSHDHSVAYWRDADERCEALDVEGLTPSGDLAAPLAMECITDWNLSLDVVAEKLQAMREDMAAAPDVAYVLPAEWDGAIFGTYYLIRPTERHVGAAGFP
jgi:hypothetical protein